MKKVVLGMVCAALASGVWAAEMGMQDKSMEKPMMESAQKMDNMKHQDKMMGEKMDAMKSDMKDGRHNKMDGMKSDMKDGMHDKMDGMKSDMKDGMKDKMMDEKAKKPMM